MKKSDNVAGREKTERWEKQEVETSKCVCALMWTIKATPITNTQAFSGKCWRSLQAQERTTLCRIKCIQNPRPCGLTRLVISCPVLVERGKLHIAWKLTFKNLIHETLSVTHIPLDLKFGTSYDQNSFKYPPLGLNVLYCGCINRTRAIFPLVAQVILHDTDIWDLSASIRKKRGSRPFHQVIKRNDESCIIKNVPPNRFHSNVWWGVISHWP